MNKTLTAILIVIVLVLGVGGAYVLFIKDDTTNEQSTTQVTTETAQDAAESSATNNSTASENMAEPSTEEGQTASVTIKNFAFAPASITVKKGTTVTWTNEDSAEHNAFSAQDGGPKGRLLSKGESYSFTFDKVGTYSYICEPHPHMKGTVTVTD